MDSRRYILKEVELQYQYKIEDQLTYSKPKYLMNDIFRSLQGSITCEFGGINELGLTDQEVKEIIKDYIEQHPVNLIKA